MKIDQCQSLQVSKVHPKIKNSENKVFSQTVPDSWNPKIKRKKTRSTQKSKKKNRSQPKKLSKFSKQSKKNDKSKKVLKLKKKPKKRNKNRSKSAKNKLKFPANIENHPEKPSEDYIKQKIMKKIFLMDSKQYRTDPTIANRNNKTKKLKPKKSAAKFKSMKNKPKTSKNGKYRVKKLKIGGNFKNRGRFLKGNGEPGFIKDVGLASHEEFLKSRPDSQKANFLKNKKQKIVIKNKKKKKSRSKSKLKEKTEKPKTKEFTFRNEEIASTLKSINLENPIILTPDSANIPNIKKGLKKATNKSRKKRPKRRKPKQNKLKRRKSQKSKKEFVESELVTVSKKSTNTMNESEAKKFEELLSKDTHKGRLLNGISYVDSLESSLAKQPILDIRRSAGPEPVRTSLGGVGRLMSEQDNRRVGRGSLGDIGEKQHELYDEYDLRKNGKSESLDNNIARGNDKNKGKNQHSEDLIGFQNNLLRQKLQIGVKTDSSNGNGILSTKNNKDAEMKRISVATADFDTDKIIKDTMRSIQINEQTPSPKEGLFFESIEEELESISDKEDQTTDQDRLSQNLKEDNLIIPSQNDITENLTSKDGVAKNISNPAKELIPGGFDVSSPKAPDLHNFQHMDFRRKSFGMVKIPVKNQALEIQLTTPNEKASTQQSEEETLDLEIAKLEELHRKESSIKLHPTVRMKIQSSYPSLNGHEKDNLPRISQSYTAKDFIRMYQDQLDNPSGNKEQSGFAGEIWFGNKNQSQEIWESGSDVKKEKIRSKKKSKIKLKKVGGKGKKKVKSKQKSKKLKKIKKPAKKRNEKLQKSEEIKQKNNQIESQSKNLSFEKIKNKSEDSENKSEIKNQISKEFDQSQNKETKNYFQIDRKQRFTGFRRESSQSFEENESQSIDPEEEKEFPTTLFYRNSSHDNINLQDDLKNLQQEVDRESDQNPQKISFENPRFHNSPHFGHDGREKGFESNLDEKVAESFGAEK